MAKRKTPATGRAGTKNIRRTPLVVGANGKPAYDSDFHIVAARRQCLLGASDAELAADFGVGVSTLYAWRRQFPELDKAIRHAKRLADGVIAESLYEAAQQRVVTQEKVVVIDGAAQAVPYRETVLQDVTAARHWLAARNPERWGLNRTEAPRDHENEERQLAAVRALIGDVSVRKTSSSEDAAVRALIGPPLVSG
jgi:transposase